MRVAVLATDGVEQVGAGPALAGARGGRRRAGAGLLRGGHITAYNHIDKGETKKVDAVVSSADPDDYAALVLPGGVINGDFVRADADAVAFVKSFFDAGKPVAAICHAPWVLVEADVVRGRRMTSWPSLQTDLRNAGATWVDEEVVVDGNLVTSRNPDDLDAFGAAIVEQFAAAADDEAEPRSRRTRDAEPGRSAAGDQPGGGQDRQQRAGEDQDGEQPGAELGVAHPLAPHADAGDQAGDGERRQQHGEVRNHLPEHGEGEVDRRRRRRAAMTSSPAKRSHASALSRGPASSGSSVTASSTAGSAAAAADRAPVERSRHRRSGPSRRRRACRSADGASRAPPGSRSTGRDAAGRDGRGRGIGAAAVRAARAGRAVLAGRTLGALRGSSAARYACGSPQGAAPPGGLRSRAVPRGSRSSRGRLGVARTAARARPARLALARWSRLSAGTVAARSLCGSRVGRGVLQVDCPLERQVAGAASVAGIRLAAAASARRCRGCRCRRGRPSAAGAWSARRFSMPASRRMSASERPPVSGFQSPAFGHHDPPNESSRRRMTPSRRAHGQIRTHGTSSAPHRRGSHDGSRRDLVRAVGRHAGQLGQRGGLDPGHEPHELVQAGRRELPAARAGRPRTARLR